MTQFITRAYNSISQEGQFLKKKSCDSKLIDEIKYYEEIHKTSLSVYFPRIFSSYLGNNQEPTNVIMEYYNYPNLGQNFPETRKGRKRLTISILELLCKFAETKRIGRDFDIRENNREMWVNKTIREYDKLMSNFPFFQTIKDQTIFLNNKPLLPLNKIWYKIQEFLEYEIKHINTEFIIHGDLCFSNILYADGVIKLVDPRGSYGKSQMYGSHFYDLAKLRHSYHGGYEAFITNNFFLHEDGLHFKLYKKNLLNVTIKKFDKSFNISNLVKVIEGTIFIGMCARHYDSLQRQKAMYLTGLQILNEMYETLL